MPRRRTLPARAASGPAPVRGAERERPRPPAGGPAAGSRIAALARHPALGCAMVAFLVYLPGLEGGFLRDDHFLIERHPYLRSEGWLGRLLLSDFWSPVSGATGMWRPLIVLSYWVDGRLGGWGPLWFHVVNAGAHALASAALALLVGAAGAGSRAAWLAGLAFAVMPAHVECVAWVSGRTDVFCALFGLAALWLDLRARAAGRPWPGWLAPAALALALLAKEVAVTLVGVLAVMEWTRMRATGATPLAAARWLAPYLAVTAAYLVAHTAFAPDPGALAEPELRHRAALRGTAWALFPGYLAFLWPWFPHSPDRAAPAIGPGPAVETAVGAVCAVALIALLASWLRRRSPGAVPLALALFPLVPPLVLASTRGYGLYGERHIYVASAGVAWGFALAVTALARAGGTLRRLAALGLAAAFLLGSVAATLRALPAYRDDAAMYRAMVEREPTNPTGFVGLAAELTTRGRVDEAAALLEAAARLDPALASVHTGRARVATRRGAWEAALAETERALALDPGLQSARLLRAVALMRLRRMDEAGRALERLRAEYPHHPEVGTVWGQYLLAIGRTVEALPVLQEAVALLPGEPGLWDALGMASVRLGRGAAARAAFERTVALTPDYLEGWMRLASVCQTLGDGAGRERALARAAALPGGDARVAAFRARLAGGAP
jgi:Flp pilus assembly protein TadD